MRHLLLIAALSLAARAATAAECAPIPLRYGGSAFTDVSLASGAVITDAFPVSPYAEVLLRADLTDESGDITNLEYLISESATATGTFGPFARCNEDDDDHTCLSKPINWNPAESGESMRLPWPAIGSFWKITVTPTGNGVGDTLSLSLLGCY